MKKESRHKHHHRHKAYVDLKERSVRIGSKTYVCEDEWDRDLGETVHLWMRPRSHNGGRRSLDPRKDRHLIRRLEHDIADAKERKAGHTEKAPLAKLEDVLAMEDARHGTQAESDSTDKGRLTPWQKHEKRPKKGSVIERDKYGTRLYSNDPTFYIDICVNPSTKYAGTSVRVSCPPGKKAWRTFTFDLETMEAFRREVDRGEQREEQKAVDTKRP
jgi:hypothetical protein